MKKSLKIIIFIAIIIIALAAIYFFVVKNGKVTIKGNSYKVVENVSEKQLKQIDSNEFETLSKKVGFDETNCEDSFCTAGKKMYKNADKDDSLTIMYDNGKISTFGLNMYFSKVDYTYENVCDEFNKVLNNYFGYKITPELVEKMDKQLVNGEDTIIEEKEVNNYIIQHILNDDGEFHIFKIFVRGKTS